MTTISATQGYQTHTAQRPPPPSGKDRLTAAIGNEVSTGALSQTDATALTSALDAIDQSLTTARTATSGRAARLDPAEMQDRIDDLISDQVSSGALTEDQADTLSELFARQGGPDGPGQAGGPPPGPPPGGVQDDSDASDDSDAMASSSASGTSGSAASDLLASFIEQLKAAQSSGTGYAASGQSGRAQASALLFDFTS